MEACKFIIENEALSEEETRRLQDALLGLAVCDRPLAFELAVVTEEQIQTLNRTERGVDRVTDVLSFPSMELECGEPIASAEHGEEIDEEGNLFTGSIAVCEKRAREQAEEYGHSYERELFYLTVHGVLHCLGYDHETEDEKREMRLKEESVMAKLGLTRE